MGNFTFFICFKILGEAGKPCRHFTTNVPKILDLKSSSEQIFSENSPWVPLFKIEPCTNCCTHYIILSTPCERNYKENRKSSITEEITES